MRKKKLPIADTLLHADVGVLRERISAFIGELMAEGATAKREGFGVGSIEVPVDRMRAIVLVLLELSHVLAVGDPDGGPRTVEGLARVVQGMSGDVVDSLHAGIAHGVVGKSGRSTDRSTREVSEDGPVGQA